MVVVMAGRRLGFSLGRVVTNLSRCCHFFHRFVEEAQREGQVNYCPLPAKVLHAPTLPVVYPRLNHDIRCSDEP
jgi:hypothetical protein